MFWFKQKERRETLVLPLNGKDTKVFLFHQNRKNCRASIGKKGVYIRLANSLSDDQKVFQTKRFLSWAEKELVSKSHRYFDELYFNGRVLNLYDANIPLEIYPSKTDKAKAKYRKERIELELPDFLDGIEKQDACSEFIVKILRKLYQDKIEQKLRTFNQQFELGDLNNVRLKNNTSNWGSCSSKGNINVSLRLLFAPEEVLDYVLIHELVHLQHPNHGLGFWRKVRECCSNYKKSEEWLKQNSHLCRL